MQGVTTALVAFIFFCVLYPHRVRNRPQFYAGVGLICGIIVLDALGMMISGSETIRGFRVFAYVACAVLQVVAILTLFMAAGGLSWDELRGEMGEAFEVIRRGEDKKTVIIPLTGAMPKVRDDDDRGDAPPVVRIDSPAVATRDPTIPAKPEQRIPLE